MLHLLQLGPFKVLISVLFYIQNSWQLSLLELPSLLRLCFLRFHMCQQLVFLFGLLQLVYLHCATWPIRPPPLLLMQHSRPTLAFKPLILLLPTSYLLPLYPPHCHIFLAVFLYPYFPFPLKPLGLFNGMLEVFVPGAPNCYTLSCLVMLTLFDFKNLTLTHLPLSGSLGSLRSDRTHAWSAIVSPDATHASGSLITFIRQGLSFELSTSSLSSLDSFSHYVGVNISLNNSSSLSFFNTHAAPICSSATDDRTDSFSPSILSFSGKISSFSETSTAITPSGT